MLDTPLVTHPQLNIPVFALLKILGMAAVSLHSKISRYGVRLLLKKKKENVVTQCLICVC